MNMKSDAELQKELKEYKKEKFRKFLKVLFKRKMVLIRDKGLFLFIFMELYSTLI